MLMKNIRTLLLLCLPLLAISSCDYTSSKVDPSSIDSVDSGGRSSEDVDPYQVDADIWMEYFDTFDAFYIDKNYSISMHITGEYEPGEYDDWNVQLETANYAMKRISWDTAHPEDKDEPANYYVSSKNKTTPTSFEVDEVRFDESRGEWISEDSYTIQKEEAVGEYVLPFKKFSSFVYDEETHYYVAEEYTLEFADMVLWGKKVRFQFYQGKLVKGDMELLSDGDKEDYFYEYEFQFGGIAFDVPDYTK